jgi:hypothetical protein
MLEQVFSELTKNGDDIRVRLTLETVGPNADDLEVHVVFGVNDFCELAFLVNFAVELSGHVSRKLKVFVELGLERVI